MIEGTAAASRALLATYAGWDHLWPKMPLKECRERVLALRQSTTSRCRKIKGREKRAMLAGSI